MAGAIVAIVLVVFLVVLLARTVRIVPQARAGSSSASGAITAR